MHPIVWFHDKAIWLKEAAPVITSLAAWVSASTAFVGAIVALRIYLQNSRLERAKWAEKFYSKFYECSDESYLRRVRNVLDSSANSKAVAEMVEAERSDFTDYLNFFELLAYFVEAKQLSRNDVLELFDYYLGCMKRHESVRNYIADRSKGYENLSGLLASIKE